MKKVFTTLITTLLLLVPTAVKAASKQINEEIKIKLYADIPSSYSIKIPRSLNTHNNLIFNIDLKGDLASEETIILTIPSITLYDDYYTNEENDFLSIEISNDKNEFCANDLDKEIYNETYGRSQITIFNSDKSCSIETLPISISLVKDRSKA